jgi:hypothetical protein
MNKIIYLSFIILVTATVLNACKHLPPESGFNGTTVSGTNNGVCFETDILPLFQSNCAKSGCHDAASHQGDYILDSYVNIIKKGLAPGNATGSKIYKVLFETGNDKMPPAPNPDLTASQKY